MNDTTQHYGLISRLFHWLMALGFLFIFATVIAWTINEDYFSLMNWHKSIGFILLIVLPLRLIWALKNQHNRPPHHFLATSGHHALYLLMLTIPAIGLIRQYGAARGEFKVFGLHIMNAAPSKIEWMTQLGNNLHSKLGWVLFTLIAGHIAMAIFHQIKGEKVLNRMIGK